MTNPDRDELVKLEAERAELIAKNEAATSWGAAVGARYERIKGLDGRIAALRRLASSDSGMKGEPEPVAWRWRDHSTGVLAPFWQYGAIEPDTYPDREVEPLYTASPADAGMREASIVTCCVTGAIPGDGGACGDCDPCLLGETSPSYEAEARALLGQFEIRRRP